MDIRVVRVIRNSRGSCSRGIAYLGEGREKSDCGVEG